MAKADLKLEYGISALNSGYKTDARRLLKESLKLDPSNWKAYFWLSRATENEEEQRSCLEKALELNPKAEPAHRDLAAIGGPHKPIDEVPSQPVAILAKLLKEQRKQAATLQKLLKQQEQLVISVKSIESAARVWQILVALGILLGCIGVVVGNPFAF